MPCRHPNYYAKTFNNHLGDFLENFTARGKTLTILGDINVDLNKSNVASNEYINTLNSAGFSTLINQPTRIFHYTGSNYVSCSTLDHIVTNSSQNFSKVGILNADVSDHLPIFGIMKLSKPNRNLDLQNTFKRFFTERNKDKFVHCLEKNLENLDYNLDPNSIMDDILIATKEAIDTVFPLKKYPGSNQN